MLLSWIIPLVCVTAAVYGRPYENPSTVTYLGYYPSGGSVIPMQGIPTSSQCLELCTKTTAAFRQCSGATYDYITQDCLLHTNIYEVCNKGSWIKDQSRRGLNIVHFALANCGSESHPNSLNGQPKNLGTGICVNVGFRRFADRNTEGGSLVANVVDEVSCNVFCQANTACWAVDFNTNTNRCFVHNTTITQQNINPGIIQYQKICPGLLTNFNPFQTTTTATTTTTSPTTAPTAIPIPTIADDGICPSPFELLPNTTLGAATSGTPQAATVNTTELCKENCLNDATCLAATFNTDTNLCYVFTAIDLTTLMRGTQSCCSHFRKLDCTAMSMRQCWSQSSTFTGTPPAPNSLYVGDGSTPASTFTMISCTGTCFYTETSEITDASVSPVMSTLTITRGCDTTVPFQDTLNCPTPTTTGTPGMNGFTSTNMYFCTDSLCNIFSRNEAQDQLLYLPFDMTIEDHSAYMRDGYFWNGTMGGFTYDSFDKKKNKSALFDGMEMICTPFNNINLNDQNPAITLTQWVKREGTTPAMMGIVSKGTTNTLANSTELFSLVSTIQGTDMHTYTFTLNLDQPHSCSTTASAIGVWQFVAVTITSLFGTTTIDMYVVADGTTTFPTTTTAQCTIAAPTEILQGALNVTQDPLCVGGSYVNEDFTPVQGSTNFFVGHLDEVRIFRNMFLESTADNFLPFTSVLNNVDQP